jgi:hypothetical protein
MRGGVTSRVSFRSSLSRRDSSLAPLRESASARRHREHPDGSRREFVQPMWCPNEAFPPRKQAIRDRRPGGVIVANRSAVKVDIVLSNIVLQEPFTVEHSILIRELLLFQTIAKHIMAKRLIVFPLMFAKRRDSKNGTGRHSSGTQSIYARGRSLTELNLIGVKCITTLTHQIGKIGVHFAKCSDVTLSLLMSV